VSLTIGPRGRLTILAAGVAFAVSAEAARLASGWALSWVVGDILPGIAFLIAGLAAWRRRPDSRIGPLMMATGFAWYAGTIATSTIPLVDRLGYAFQGYYDGLLAWLVLAYPTGRLHGMASRVVMVFFGVLGLRTLFRLAMFRMNTDYDFSLSAEIDRYVGDLTLRDTGDTFFRGVIAVLAVIVLILLVRRLLTESGVARRIAGPMILAGLALAIGVIVEYGAISIADTPDERFAAWDVSHMLTNLTGGLVALAFGIGLTRSRLARGSVADLVLELGATRERPALRDLIARALRDPSLELLFPGPSPHRYLDAGGTERTLPDASASDRGVTRLEGDGQTLAVLVHDAALSDQPELIRSVAAAAGLAVDNERLTAEVRAQLAEVRASRARIVATGDEQRRRIERDLHDGAQQRLVTLALRLQMARGLVDEREPSLGAALDEASRELELALAELRQLARGLHPSVLSAEGLRPAFEMLADRSPVAVRVVAAERRFPAAVEAAAYFVVAEALTNVAKYADATAVMVRLDERDGALVVAVEDNGIGGADPDRGSGLRGLEDRVAAVGGRLTVTSEKGRGTTIAAEIPCALS
jgi:signal transduction histidine kinase